MNGLKNFATGGWHPEKSGQKESWRGDFKGINQIAGWVGKGKNTSAAPPPPKQHRSAPLSTLKDPAIFGPPPKNARYHGQDAVHGGSMSPDVEVGVVKREPSPEPQQDNPVDTNNEPEEPGPPPMPSRTPTGGLSSGVVPRLPPRRVTTDGTPAAAAPPVAHGKPSLPPRLPPRAGTTSSLEKPAPSEGGPLRPVRGGANIGQASQGALDRLGKAGVSVPGLNIGTRSAPAASELPSAGDARQNPGDDGAGKNQLQQLSSRFSRLSSSSSSPSSPAPNTEAPTSGTSFAQKQAAVRTISSFQKDPTSVSVSDAKAAASTANNFRQRHGTQVAQGWKVANELNTKYGVVDRMQPQTPDANESGAAQAVDSPQSASPAGQKSRPPPPPPPKRRDLSGA